MNQIEIQEIFREYLAHEIDSGEVSEFFMQFTEDWAESELYGFALNDKMHEEFVKWLAEKLEKEFADENDINVSEVNGYDIVAELV